MAGVEAQSDNWIEYFERWGLTAVKDDIIKPRLNISEKEALRMNGSDLLGYLTKIKDEDARRWKDAEDLKKKMKEEKP